MKKGNMAYDPAHYLILDILLFLLLYAFVIGYVHNLYGEKEVDVIRTSLQLEYAFTERSLLNCFSDPITLQFDRARLTEDVLAACTSHNVRVTLEDLDTSEKTVV